MSDSSAADTIVACVRRIPEGRVATYGQIASLAGRPKNARQVGTVLRSLPEDSGVPWHRVVNAQGRISQRDSATAEGLQRFLLRSESIPLDDSGRIDLSLYQWKPRRR